MRLESDARARSVDGTVARGKMPDAKHRAETRNVCAAIRVLPSTDATDLGGGEWISG